MTSPDDVRRTLDELPDIVPLGEALAALALVVVVVDGEPFITRSSLAAVRQT